MELTVEEYNGLGFEDGEREDFSKTLARAKMLINVLTDNKCDKSDLNEAEERMLKQAIYAQCENMLLYGYEQEDFYSKAKIGDFSYETADCRGNTAEGIKICPLSLAILKLGGLFYRGTAVKDVCQTYST